MYQKYSKYALLSLATQAKQSLKQKIMLTNSKKYNTKVSFLI